MRSTSLFIAALAGAVSAQNLTSVLSSNNNTSGLLGLLGNYPDLVATLAKATNITVLAPSNDAINALIASPAGQQLAGDSALAQAVLTYHVIQGTFAASDVFAATSNGPDFLKTLLTPGAYANVTGGQNLEVTSSSPNVTFISGLAETSNVIQADVKFDGGVVHVIDKVLTLPANVSTTAGAANLTALASALTQANLVSTVESLQDITVFAPNNQAFENIGSALGSLNSTQLTDILTYHVVQGVVAFSTDLTNGETVPTVNGANVTITIEGSNVFVNGAQVIQPNVLISNGVVHVIDNVLNPANATATPAPSASSGLPAYSGASSASISLTSGAPSATASLGNGTTAAMPTASGSASGSGASGSSSAMASQTANAAPMITAAYPIAGLLAAGAAFVI